MEASNVTKTLFEQLSFRGERQKVISSNIANINTPKYKTKDLVFESELEKVNKEKDLQLYTTNPNHIKEDLLKPVRPNPSLVEVKGLEEQNDGNNVSLDKQMSEMAKNAVMFNALNAAIKKDSRLFKSVIESSSKN